METARNRYRYVVEFACCLVMHVQVAGVLYWPLCFCFCGCFGCVHELTTAVLRMLFLHSPFRGAFLFGPHQYR